MNTILVTGATGFLGGNLIRRLSREGYHLIALIRNKEGWNKLLNIRLRRSSEQGESNGNSEYLEDVELIQGDVTSPLLGLPSRRFRRLAWQVDAIFHCAALTDFAYRANLFHTNVEGTRHLLQFALLGRKKHFHHISSAYVAGKSNGTFYEEDFNKGQGFNNSYEESKFNSEALVRRFAREHLLPFTVYRPSIIVGDSMNGRTQCYKGFYTFARALFLIKMRTLKGHEAYKEETDPGKSTSGMASLPQRAVSVKIPMRIFGDPEGLINLVPVDYVVEAISELSKRPDAQGKTFHLTNPNSITLAELTDKVIRASGIEGPCCQDTGTLGGPILSGDTRSASQEHSRLSPTERFLLHYTRPYLPYLQSYLSFDTSNTGNALDGTVTCPRITQPLVSLLIDRAIEDRWGIRCEEDTLVTTAADSACAMTG